MWKDVLLGVLPVIAALGGVALEHYLTAQQQSKIARVDYARDALRRVRLYCDNIERVVIWVGMSLFVRCLGVPKSMEEEIEQKLNIEQVMMELAQPHAPEIPDEAIQKQWEKVSDLFNRLLISRIILDYSDSRDIAESSTWQMKEALPTLKKFRDVSSTKDFAKLRAQLATDESSQFVYDMANELVDEVQKLRAEVMRASTKA